MLIYQDKSSITKIDMVKVSENFPILVKTQRTIEERNRAEESMN